MFGPAWADVDRNGCDQRNDVLHRDLTEVQVREGTHECVVVAGVLDDPYTGATWSFEKADAAEVPIDHVVPLAAAWVQGAAAWPTEQRQAFANDLNNLMATTRAENSAKGDSTADEWVPSDPSLRLLVRHRRDHGEAALRAGGQPGGGRRAAVAARHLLSAAPTARHHSACAARRGAVPGPVGRVHLA